MSSIANLAVPPPPLPRLVAAAISDPAPRSGCGWELPRPDTQLLLLLNARPTPMQCLGDASARLAKNFVVVLASPEMRAEGALLSTNVVVAWIEGDIPDVSSLTVAAAIARAFGKCLANISVVRHFPE